MSKYTMEELAELPEDELEEILAEDDDLVRGILCYKIGKELHQLADEL